MTIDWKSRYAQRNQSMGRSIIRELLKMTTQPDLISLAGGLPAPELFPIERIREATGRLLASEANIALQYGQTEGYQPLRQYICEQMARYGIQANMTNVVVTHGSQQALDLVGKALIDSGNRILVEEPSYLGALQAWNSYQADYISVPMDDNGLRTDLLEDALKTEPKFMYVLPNFQNPSGATLSLERRQELVHISNSRGIPILEDDPYGALRYEGEHIPSLAVLDARYQTYHGRYKRGFEDSNVIYLGSFSKTLAPGLRLGWIVAPDEILDKIVISKQGADLHTSTFTQVLVYEIVKDGFLDEHIHLIRQMYRQRRDVMLQSLESYFPEESSWTHPQGGLFLWARGPEWLDTTSLLVEAVKHKVAYVPGSAFYADPSHGQNTMRLNFSNMLPEQVEEGILRLGNLLKRVIARKARRHYGC